MGCLHNIAEETVTEPNGDCRGLSYLVNSETNGFIPIIDLALNEYVFETEVESWERRLGVDIPKPPTI